MRHLNSRTRLFVKDGLDIGQLIKVSEGQAHYLNHVVRMNVGDYLSVFNGRDGQWQAQIVFQYKKGCELKVESCEINQTGTRKLTLGFVPIKGESAHYIVEKATELGVTDILPVLTQRAIVKNINREKLTFAAIEAAEQCERLDVPEVYPMVSLPQMLATRRFTGKLILCDETLNDVSPLIKLRDISGEDHAILIGPEGGFSSEELAILRSLDYVLPISLGRRILRVETAIVSALAVYQAIAGDW